MKKSIIVVALLAAFGASAGPLGLHKGMTLEELQKQGDFKPGEQKFFYRSKTIVSGHQGFEAYSVVLTPEQGLCKITAIGKDVDSSSYGTELEGEYKNLVAALTGKYGEPLNNFSFLKSGSIWNEPKDWMMGLFKKERTLATFWEAKDNNLPDSITSIMVETLALSGSKGYIKLSYEFNNFEKCFEIIKSKRNTNL